MADDYLATHKKLERGLQWLDLVHLELRTDWTRMVAPWLW